MAANLWQLTHLYNHQDGDAQHNIADAGTACVLFGCEVLASPSGVRCTHVEQCHITEC